MNDQEQLDYWRALKAEGRLIELDYGLEVRSRSGHGGRPWDPHLTRKLQQGHAVYRTNLLSFKDYLEPLASVPAFSETGLYWRNDWLPAFDGVSIYGFLARRNPSIYLEIGSGFSTLFARRAIVDHDLRTQIISIDPFPRREIDAICDEVVRKRFEDVEMSLFENLPADAVVFCDNSHRALMNSDATVFFTEALPALNPGVLVGIHDIFLPADYPPEWTPRYYNEQYLLACYLLGGDRLKIELPIYYAMASAAADQLHGALSDFWAKPNLADVWTGGGAFWVSVAESSKPPLAPG